MPTGPIGAQAYLTPGRLADVIAALQLLGAETRPEGPVDYIAARLSPNEDRKRVSHWQQVFVEHPEFFLVYTLPGEANEKVALRLRYANKLVDPDTGVVYTKGDTANLDPDIRDRLTTKPLASDAIGALMGTAIQLYGSAAAERSDNRWWVSVFAPSLAFLGAIGGSLLSPLVAALFKSVVPR